VTVDDPIERIWATIQQQADAVGREQTYRQAQARALAAKALATAERKRREIEALMRRG